MYAAVAAENRKAVAVRAFGSLYRRQLFDWIIDVCREGLDYQERRKDQIRSVVLSKCVYMCVHCMQFLCAQLSFENVLHFALL